MDFEFWIEVFDYQVAGSQENGVRGGLLIFAGGFYICAFYSPDARQNKVIFSADNGIFIFKPKAEL